MGFQIALKGEGGVFVRKGDSRLGSPWTKFLGVNRFPRIVTNQSSTEITSVADVGLSWERFAAEDVDVVRLSAWRIDMQRI